MGTNTQQLSNLQLEKLSNQIVEWQSVVTADGSTGLTAVAGRGYFINTTSGTITVTLPGSAKVGDTITLKDYAGTWATNNVTITSTLKISGADADGTLSTNNTTVTIVYMDTTKGWTPIQNSTQDALASDASFITATGGTVTESGDYKIHTFTGDGCFVVSSVGNPAGSDSVDYLVVAGGGAAAAVAPGGVGTGGGGGGGLRFYASPDITSYPGSPLNGPAALSVTTTTYPVTVGGGGAPGPSAVNNIRGDAGTSSIFSTITSTGGGGGGADATENIGGTGGSGGGGANTAAGGSGNTPPTSPSQGNNGGSSACTSGPGWGAGGGGGALAVGGNACGPTAGPGGVGAGFPTAFVASNGEPSSCEQYFSGGGGGGTGYFNNPGVVGTGGTGGGGDGKLGACSPTTGNAGTANTGGGGGGVASGSGGDANGGPGGKGIVIIRYKFQ